tara:strand:- start:3098 stop:13885 length:10788 start_codon:yes stop_codon:yes gene_type:complete
MANQKWKKLVLGNSVKQSNDSYPPVLSSTPAAFNAPAGTASVATDAAYNPGVSYSAGDMLFYTDGKTVYDSLGNIMDGGTLNGLNGDNKAAQTAVILKSSETNYWWILTHDSALGRVYVHNVLMTGNSGRGTVSQNQTITSGGGSAAHISIGAATTDRFNAFYSTSTSQYGFMTHLKNSNRHTAFLITGVSSHLPVFGSVVMTIIGSLYANNDAANHATIKFNEDNTKMATVLQMSVGTSGTPVTTAIVEVYDLNPTTGVLSNFNSFVVPIKDAGAVTPGAGNDGRLKGYDLEWDFDTSTLYVPVYDASNGLGVNWYTLNASNAVTAQGTVGKSMNSLGSNPDKAIFGMYKDPYEDRIYLTKPAVVGTSGGYSSDYNDTYATNSLSVIRDTSDPVNSEFTETVATTVPGDTIGKGTPTRPMAGEGVGASSYYTLTPCDTQKEYIMDTLGSIWVLDGALDATKIADVSSISDRVNIAVQKETNFIYLLAGTGATPKVYKIDPVTGTVDAGTTLSGTGVTGFNSISSKDGDSTKLYAVVTISGPHYNYAEIVIATGVATKTAGNTSHVAVDTAMITGTLYMASGDDLYKNTGPGTWATVGANTLSKNYEGLSTDDTTLYGYIEGKRYTINTSTGAATAGKSITINSSTGTWNYTAQGAGIVNIATLTTNDTNPGSYLDKVISVTNFAGCYTVTTAGSGSAVIGTILSHSDDCGSCSSIESDNYCKLLVSCCDSGYKGLGFTREIVGTSDDPTCSVGSYYEITANAQSNDQLNRCVEVQSSDDSLYIIGEAAGFKVDLTTGSLDETLLTGGSDIAFNKHGVGFTPVGNNLYYTIPVNGSIQASNSTPIYIPQSTTVSFNYSDELITGGVISGVTQVSRNTINKKGVLTTVNTLTNTTVQLTGDLAVDKITGEYYCIGDSSPTATPVYNDLFKLDPSTLTHTVIADLTSTLSLSAHQTVKAIEIVKDSCYVLVWNSSSFAITLYRINKDTGALISTLPIIKADGGTEFRNPPSGLGYNNPCMYWDTGAFKLANYSSCSTCFASPTSKNCCFELVDCETGASTITSTDVSAYLGQIIVTDNPGKCYTVYSYDNSITCTGAVVNVTKSYPTCSECTPVQTTCYRLLKCDDPTSDPKYTTEALTSLIRNKVGKTVRLEGENFCRNVDNQGNAVNLNSATTQVIKSTKRSCTECNFYLKLKQCGAPNIVRYVDYTSSTSLHGHIGTGAVKIQDLGKGENGHCWQIDSTIYGPTTALRPTAQLVLSASDCTICNAQNNEAFAPAFIKINGCCSDLNPTGNYGSEEYYTTDPALVSAVLSGDLIFWGDLTDPYGNLLQSRCFKIEMSPSPVATNLLSQVQIDGTSSDAGKCEACDPLYISGCEAQVSDNVTMMLSCNVDKPIHIFNTALDSYDNDANRVYNFNQVDLVTGCYKKCITADYVHGVNWLWGSAAYLTWESNLGYPTANAGVSAANMGTLDADLNNNDFFTKFGSTVHSAHEDVQIGTKQYSRGSLMFYSDGHFVYNSSHQSMAGSFVGASQLLNGGVSPQQQQFASQQCITVPKPDSDRFAGSTTYKQYYLIYQKPLTMRPQYAVINMDTADGLGEIISYNQDLPYLPGSTQLSTERLTVTSRPAIADSDDDSYWVLDVIPYEAPTGWGIGFAPIGKIRAWKITSSGIDAPILSNMIGSVGGSFPGKIEGTNLTEWARIKVSPTNSHVAITGNNSGIGWTQLYTFDESTGACVGIWQETVAGGFTTCGTAVENVEGGFMPYTHGVEFGDNALFTYRSGMSYCNAFQCNEYNNGVGEMTWINNGTINEPDWVSTTNTNTFLAGGPTTTKAILSWVNLDTLAEGQQTQDIDTHLPDTLLGTNIFRVSNPSTRLQFCGIIENQQTPQLCSGGYFEAPNEIKPAMQASIVTDLHRGPDGALYAGLVLGNSSGSVSNAINWRETFLGIGDATPSYDLTFQGNVVPFGADNNWDPQLEGTSSQRIARTQCIRKFNITNIDSNDGNGYVLPSGPNIDVVRSAVLPNNSTIDFGFPQFVKRKCFAVESEAMAVTVANANFNCTQANTNGNCINQPPEPDVFKIINCGQSAIGCASVNDCQDFTPGTAVQLDGESQRFGMTEYLNQDIWDAIQQLASGPQAVYMTYSFPREGSITPSSYYAGGCVAQSPGGGDFAGGQFTIPKHESGPTTTNAQGNSSNNTIYDKTYTITEAQFRAEVGKAFDMVTQLFESTFSPQNGYPNQLILRFTDLGKETGTDSALPTSDLENWSTSAPIGFTTTTGASGVGDFRIWMGRRSDWCYNTGGNPGGFQTSGCTGCNYTGSASGALAWATGPSMFNTTAGYNGDSGNYNTDPSLAFRTSGSQNIIFDVNENWRKTTDTQVANSLEILRVGIHEILHSFGFHHAYESMALQPNCQGTTGAGTTSGSFINQGGFSCPENGIFNAGCAEDGLSYGDPNAIMAPTANSTSFTTIYAPGTDTAYDATACYMSGGSAAAIQDRTMVCQIYGFGIGNAPSTFCEPFDCPLCVSQFYYSDDELFWQYVGQAGNNTSFTWNPGTGLSCWYAELADQLPAGDSLTTITPVTGYIDCEACNVQFQDPRWRLVLCDECPENIGNGAPGEIITSTNMDVHCTPGAVDDDPSTSDVLELVGYIGCYKVDCEYDPYLDYQTVAIPVVVSQIQENCDTCCTATVTQCYTVTQCADTNPISFVMMGDSYWGGITNLGDYVFKFVQLPADVLALGLTNDDCFTVAYCGACNETTCNPIIGPGLLSVAESWPGCYSCLYENPSQECFKLVCCDSSGDQLINVLPNADLNSAFATGSVVQIDQYPDSQGNPRCWTIETQDICNPEIAVTVINTYVNCGFCNTTVFTAGCTDPSALNYCPGCTTCLSNLGVLNYCCIYEGCPLSCQDPTATNYNPNNTCDCSGVEGGSDTSCCSYPAIVIPPEGVEVTFEKDCVNCLDWTTVDKVFANAAELCGSCFPPLGLTLREYDCNVSNVETVIPPITTPGGCTNPEALNYNAAAEWDDGSCYYTSACTDPTACNFDPNAVQNIPSECVYAGQCGCQDFTDSCVGCMDITACNYDADATVADNTLCEYASCYGCTDPEAENYCADCIMCPDAACCANNVQSCLDNRNIYVFYDMTSIISGSGEEKLQACINLKNLVDAAMEQILVDNAITNFSGNVYHLPVGYQWGSAIGVQWRNGSSDPANWIVYEDTTNTGDFNLSASYYGGASSAGGYFETDFTGFDNVIAPASDNGMTQLHEPAAERWIKWMMYPIHGNAAALHPNLRIPFASVNALYKDTGLEYTPQNGYTTQARLLAKSLNSNGLDQNGNYINNLPGTQVNPFGDPIGEEGFSDVYHQFEGGDTSAICLMFVDESHTVYMEQDYLTQTIGTMLVNDNLCGPGVISTNPAPVGNANWYTANPSQYMTIPLAVDHTRFTEVWNYGYNTVGVAPMTVKHANGPIGSGYSSGNFNTIVFPTKLTGTPGSLQNQMFIQHLYGTVGQGNPSSAGIISCGNFIDQPWPQAVSMAPFTDPNYSSPYTALDNSLVTNALQDNSVIPPGRYSSQGFSLANYGVTFKIPAAGQELLEISQDDLADAILQGLLCNNGG